MQAAGNSQAAEPVTAYCLQLLRKELGATPENAAVERLSIALGAVEQALTPRDQSKAAWPGDLPGIVDSLAAAYDAFAEELSASPALAAAPSTAAKVKAVADAVWSKLVKGSYSKDLPHAQHVYSFAAALAGLPGAKRQLDCAGVVTTTYSLCQALYQRHPERHADLAAVRMQVSEDHCWLQLGGAGARETSVEVTTDTAAKRGLPVAADAWRGWLYTGGAAVLCDPHQALAALVTSLNPSISSGKKGADSEELQGLQKALLEALLAERPAALYPAALCALADLKEVFLQDALDAALEAGDAAAVARLLQRAPDDSQALFERAIQLAAGGSDTAKTEQPAAEDGVQQAAAAANGGGSSEAVGGQWYVYSYIAAFLARRAAFLASCADALPPPAGDQQPPQQHAVPGQADGEALAAAPAEQLQQQQQQQQQPADQQQQQQQQHPYWAQAVATYGEALRWAGRGGRVLASYRFQPATDDQLHKDVEGVLEEVCRDGLAELAKRQPGSALADPALLAPLLGLWDGICHLFAGRAKPSSWTSLLLKCVKLFTPEARAAAAEAAAAAGQASSGPMQRVSPAMWRDLKPLAALQQQLEAADVVAGGGAGGADEGGRAAKRRRG